MKGSLAALAVLGSAGCGWISPSDRALRWDVDQDGFARPEDCDDRDPGVHPAQVEACDARGIDDDCDGLADDEDPDCGEPATTPGVDPGCGPPPIAAVTVTDAAGERATTTFRADASHSVGTELQYRFDWGDGPGPSGPEATSERTLDAVGWLPVQVEVEDRCGRTAAAEAHVAVGTGSVLVVDTTTDEADPETFPRASSGWSGAGLSLREALTIAAGADGAQVVTFAPDLGPVVVGDRMPALSDPGGILVGPGVLVGSAVPSGRLEVTGQGAVVAGLELSGFDGPEGAVLVNGVGVILHGLVVQDSKRGITVRGSAVRVEATTLVGNGPPQVQLDGSADLIGVEVGDGDGDGIQVKREGGGSSLVSCTVWGNGGAGVVVDKDADVAILDSTLTHNERDGVSVKDAEDLDLRNVVLAWNGGWGVGGNVWSWASGAPSHDSWFANGAGDCMACGTLGEGSLTVDPLLTDPAAGDATPLPGSPLIDAGTDATGVDRNGVTEGSWFDDGPDIGAVETR